MGQREHAIIAQARLTLNDTDKQNYRWSDKRLFEHLTDAQDDMCRQLPLIARKYTINTASGVLEYTLPMDCVRILNASSGGETIQMISAEELTSINSEWEEHWASSFTHLVVNQLSQYEVRPYPRMSESQTNSGNLQINVRYSAMPIALGWVEETGDTLEELAVSPMWDFALRHFVISMAFLDYGDESNLGRSTASAQYYGRELKRAEQLSKKSFAKRRLTTPYQGRVANTSKLIRKGQRNGR